MTEQYLTPETDNPHLCRLDQRARGGGGMTTDEFIQHIPMPADWTEEQRDRARQALDEMTPDLRAIIVACAVRRTTPTLYSATEDLR